MARVLNSVVDRAVIKRIEPLCAEFEARLLDGQSPAIEDFVARANAEDRAVLTVELAEMEIDHRRIQGDSPRIEEYRERFGDLAEFLAIGSDTRPSPGSGEGAVLTPPVDLEPLSGGQRLGPYELLRKVGLGAFGEVWQALDTRLKRMVAVKTPRSDVTFMGRDLDRFCAEAERVAQLRHPHIAAVHDVGQVGRRPYIVYEFIDGETLRDLLGRGRLEQRAALALFCRVCDAVDCAHRAGIIHRDLKPGNILIDTSGKPHVVDFGMAKMPTADLTLIGTGEIAGTPQYMSPEQAAGANRSISKATDVYALGVILYELLAGKRPFQSTSSDLLRRIREEPPRPLRDHVPDIRPELEEICQVAMAKKPGDRYETAGQLGQAVGEVLATMTEEADDEARSETVIVGRQPPGKGISRRQFFLWGGAAALVVALVPISMWYASKRSTVNIHVTTKPEGARVVFWKIDSNTNEPDPDKRYEGKRSPVEIALRPGRYLVVAALDDGRFHEVYRTVPDDPRNVPEGYPHSYWDYDPQRDVANWQRILIPEKMDTKSMVFVEGADDFLQGFEIPDDHDATHPSTPRFDAPPLHIRLPGFWIDQHETTWAEYRQVQVGNPPTWSKALPAPREDEPVLLAWPEAMDYAERAGKRLMTEAEYEFVASNRGTTGFPWGDDPGPARPWSLHSVTEPGADVTVNPPGVRGLYSNAGEWTVTALFRPAIRISQIKLASQPRDSVIGTYIVRGFPLGLENSLNLKDFNAERIEAAMADLPGMSWTDRGVRFRGAAFTAAQHGFRCVVSVRPRLKRDDLQITSIDDELLQPLPR